MQNVCFRRAAELPDSPVVRISTEDAGLSDDLRSYFAEPVRDHFESRSIRIDPIDWAEGQALVLRE